MQGVHLHLDFERSEESKCFNWIIVIIKLLFLVEILLTQL